MQYFSARLIFMQYAQFLSFLMANTLYIDTDRQTDRSITHKPRKAYQYIALTAYHILYTVTQMGSVGQSKKKKKTALIRYPYMQTTKAPLKSYSAYIPRGSGLYTIYCRTKQKRVGICITIQPLNMYLNTAFSSKYREKKRLYYKA